VGLIPMLNELPVSDPPYLDVAPSQFLAGGRKHGRTRPELDRMAVGRGQRDACHHLVASHNGVVELHVNVRESVEIALERCLSAGEALSRAAVMLKVIRSNDAGERPRIMVVECSDIALKQGGAGARAFGSCGSDTQDGCRSDDRHDRSGFAHIVHRSLRYCWRNDGTREYHDGTREYHVGTMKYHGDGKLVQSRD